ncbi:MAG: hypothetical protein IJE89_01325 [Bacilli bacterium]|nr:hypothetical protein [Bacilli bacterium]
MYKKLSIEEKICQKLVLGCNSSNVDIIVSMIEKYSIGGVILYKKNYKNYKEMVNVINRLKNANKNNKIPLFISIDQEGGRVNRMPLEFKNIKNIYDISYKDSDLVYKSGLITGEMLSSLGINMNFSPVLDVYNNSSKLLYKRCFYGDLEKVNNSSIKYINGLKEKGIISVVKHFPGHGISKIDSHFIIPYVFNNKLIKDHVKPFENAINYGVDSLMVGHLIIKGMTRGLSASISSLFINKFIREKYNYNGLIVTDEIGMLSRNKIFRFSVLKKAILSGGDLILMKIDKEEDSLVNKLVSFVKRDKNNIDIINDSVKRIISIKEKYMINDNLIDNKCDIDKINKEIEEINRICE